MQNMTPEQREQVLQRMRERGFDPSAGGRGGNLPGAAAASDGSAGGRGGGAGSAARGAGSGKADRGGAPAPPLAQRTEGATTIDALFGPLQRVETFGRAWQYVDKQLKPVRLRLGITDGQNTELIEGDVKEGTELVTNISTGAESTRPAATFPFGQPGRGGFPGGGFGGGGRGGGGAAGGGARGGGR
jgi:hypothetical protein